MTQTRTFGIVLIVLSLGWLTAAAARAQDATVEMEIFKIGFIVGGGGGSGVLHYEGKSYAFEIGGLSLGATIGASKTELMGEVYNLNRLEDFTGTYTATGTAAVLGGGETEAELENNRGVQIRVGGKAIGLELSVDLSGMEISLK